MIIHYKPKNDCKKFVSSFLNTKLVCQLQYFKDYLQTMIKVEAYNQLSKLKSPDWALDDLPLSKK